MLTDEYLEAYFLRSQLDQVEKDINIGLIEKSDAELTKTMLSRKIVKKLKQNEGYNNIKIAPIKTSLALVCLIFGTISIGSVTTYLAIGNNSFLEKTLKGKPDEKFPVKSSFLTQKSIEEVLQKAELKSAQSTTSGNKELFKLIEQLKTTLLSRPNDLEGHLLLVTNSVRIGDYFTARKAQLRVLEILGQDASSADYSKYAALCFRSASGYISVDSAKAIEKSLEKNPSNFEAQYFYSQQLIQEKDFSSAYEVWMSIFKKAPKNSKWIKVLTEEIFYRVSKAGQYSLDEKGPRQIVSELIKYLPNVMESWESRLLALDASFDEWQQLIRTYHRLGLQTKVQSSIAKAQGLLSLSKGQVEELKNPRYLYDN